MCGIDGIFGPTARCLIPQMTRAFTGWSGTTTLRCVHRHARDPEQQQHRRGVDWRDDRLEQQKRERGPVHLALIRCARRPKRTRRPSGANTVSVGVVHYSPARSRRSNAGSADHRVRREVAVAQRLRPCPSLRVRLRPHGIRRHQVARRVADAGDARRIRRTARRSPAAAGLRQSHCESPEWGQ